MGCNHPTPTDLCSDFFPSVESYYYQIGLDVGDRHHSSTVIVVVGRNDLAGYGQLLKQLDNYYIFHYYYYKGSCITDNISPTAGHK
jgi:hypothetical protein